MKQAGYVHIEIEKEENKYTFVMPMGASLADAADASFQVFRTVDKMYRDAVDKELARLEKEEAEKVEESK